MLGIINILRKMKRKYDRLKKNEYGGEAVNNVLMLVVTILIIALLLVFTISQLELAKQGILDLFEIPQGSYINPFYFIKSHNRYFSIIL